MGYKIVIPVIAIVAVLFTSGLALDSFAKHEFERGKSAYMFDCSGANGEDFGHWKDVRNFIEDNNGSYHPCGYNWMYQAFTDGTNNDRTGYHMNDNGESGDGTGAPCEHAFHCYNGKPVDHGTFGITGNTPVGWDNHIRQYKDSTTTSKMPELANTENTKLILRGYSYGGAAATMNAIEVDRRIDLVFLIDPVGPAGARNTLVKDYGTHEALPIDMAQDRIFPSRVTQVIHYYQTEAIPPSDFGFTGGFADHKRNVEQHVHDCKPLVNDPKCHGKIASDSSKVQFKRFFEEIKAMNSEPVLDDFPVITIDEGTETIVEINATDTISAREIASLSQITTECPAGSQYGYVGFGFCVKVNAAACPTGTHWTAAFGDECRGIPVCPDEYDFNGSLGCYNPTLAKTIPVLDSYCNEGSQMGGTGIKYCYGDLFCPAGLRVNKGEFSSLQYLDCLGDPQKTYDLDIFPKLTLRILETPDDLDIISSTNGTKTECIVFGNLHEPSGCTQHNKIIREGNVVVYAEDNSTTTNKILIQAEDNGFPCGNCTIAGNNAMGSLGHWDRKELYITVQNVAPTVNGFGTFEGSNLRLFVHTTDPSPVDTAAGFNYTVNWGDGSNEVIEGNSTDVLNHLYEPGEYTVAVYATDKDGGISNQITQDVETPFWKLLQLIKDLKDDGTLNKGNANSFTSKVNAIIGSFEKPNPNSACNVAEALINEIKNGFEKPGKLSLAISDDLIEKIKEEREPLGCNGGVIDVVKRTDPASATQFSFTGDVSGTIADGQKIRLGNLTSGNYSATETVPSDWTLSNIVCSAIDYTKDLATNSTTINLQENEYAVCVFFNTNDEDAKDSSSTSLNTANTARFFSLPGNSNPSSPQTSDDLTDDDKGGGGNEHLTRPTFGLSHETFETIVDSGFRFNDQSFTINDNFHTPFAQQTVNIGEINTFEAKIYADKRLKVQEFLFGIPNVGEAHLAELGVEVWYDYNGEIEEVKAIQKSNVIDKETIVATHEKTKCQALDIEQKCDLTNVSMVFLEPLKDQVMAVKAIDYKGRYQITYLNEGVEIAGESLNPMQTYLIPSNLRDQGLIKVTQLAKYSPYWQSDDDRMFEMNSFGSFKEINKSFERFQDTGTAYTRLHSGFGGVMAYELKRATGIFDASELISEFPDFIPYTPPEISERMTEEMKAKMLEQEEIAKKIIEESKVQARW